MMEVDGENGVKDDVESEARAEITVPGMEELVVGAKKDEGEEDSILEEMRMVLETGGGGEETTVQPPPPPAAAAEEEEAVVPQVGMGPPPSPLLAAPPPQEDLKQQTATDTNPQIQMEDLKVAEEEMNEVDVLVCGGCHDIFHFVQNLTLHKAHCTRKSNFRNTVIEDKPQVWAFLLWKNAQGKQLSSSGEVMEESSWKLYQKWCKMPERMRNAWIAAGGAVMTYTTFALKQSSAPPLVPPPPPQPPLHSVYPKAVNKISELDTTTNGEVDSKVVMKKLVQRDHTGEIKEIRSPNDPPPPKQTTLKDEIESIRNQLEGKDIGQSSVENGGTLREEEFVVEKIVSRRFNPKKKQYEYLLKWEGYPPEQNTWEPAENLETCQHLLKQFEENLAKQNQGKGKSHSGRRQNEERLASSLPGPSSAASSAAGRPVRHSKQKALNQVKQWCGSIKPDDIDNSLKRKFDFDSDEEEFIMRRRLGESDSEDSLMAPPPSSALYKSSVLEGAPVKRKVGRPPKNRNNLVNGGGGGVAQGTGRGHHHQQGAVEPNLAAALGLESDSEDSPLTVLNQRAAVSRVSNLSPINQQVLVANAKGVVKVDPSQVPNLTSGVYIMSNKSIVKLDSVTPSKALALKGQPTVSAQTDTSNADAQVVMIKKSGPTTQYKSGIVRKSSGAGVKTTSAVAAAAATAPLGRPPRPSGSIRVTTPGSKLQSGIVPRHSVVAGLPSGVRPRGSVSNNVVRVPLQKKIDAEKKIFIGTKSSGRGALKSGIHRKSSVNKVNADDLEIKLRDLKAGETTDIFEDLEESQSSESDVGLPDDFPKEMGPVEPASPPRPLTLCPRTGRVLSKAEGERTPEPTPPPSPNTPRVGSTVVQVKRREMQSEAVVQRGSKSAAAAQSTATAPTPKALFVSTPTSGSTSGSNMGKPLIVNTSQSCSGSSSAQSSAAVNQESALVQEADEEDDMVTITGEDGLVYKVSNSDLGSLLGGEEGEQCVYVTEGEEGDTVLALAHYPPPPSSSTSTPASSATAAPALSDMEGAAATGSGHHLSHDQHQFYIKEEPGAAATVTVAKDSGEVVSLHHDSQEEPQVIAQLVEASEPAPGGQRRVVLLLPDGNLMMTEVDEEQYAALELDK